MGEKNHLILPSTVLKETKRQEGKVQKKHRKLRPKAVCVLYDGEKKITEKRQRKI